MGQVLVSLIIVAIVCLVVYKLFKDKKNGKSSCGCNCANCDMHCGHKTEVFSDFVKK
ncbi:MAG: FeoB-associated Cys-rich membrane protein [Lachnospiraceae bacterium]|jgi:hypothetical protein|nr:FeoB-associated Cys-rich membrane protein [Lachnospiraceae bacterium]